MLRAKRGVVLQFNDRIALMKYKLAICSWSLRPKSPEALFESLFRIGINRIQLALRPVYEGRPEWQDIAGKCEKRGVEIVSGMFEPADEDYSSLDSIKRTGGLVPDSTWERNLSLMEKCACAASDLRLKLVTFHAGVIPHPGSAEFEKMAERVLTAAGIFRERGIAIALETGQETAETMKDFMEAVSISEAGINFDPGNMILYDKGDPVHALEILFPYIRQCHIKDAQRTAVPGTWGEEVAAGGGEVDWRRFFSVLTERGYEGALSIEREAGADREGDIAKAVQMVKRFVSV